MWSTYNPPDDIDNTDQISRKGVLDYLSVVMILGASVGATYSFLQTGNIGTTTPFWVILLAAVALLNRQKRPREKRFTCARCKKISEHDKRTIRKTRQSVFRRPRDLRGLAKRNR